MVVLTIVITILACHRRAFEGRLTPRSIRQRNIPDSFGFRTPFLNIRARLNRVSRSVQSQAFLRLISVSLEETPQNSGMPKNEIKASDFLLSLSTGTPNTNK